MIPPDRRDVAHLTVWLAEAQTRLSGEPPNGVRQSTGVRYGTSG